MAKMPKHDPIQESLEQLSTLRAASDDAGLSGELRGFLRNRSNLVIAKAAKIAGERRVAGLVPDLVVAFHKLMRDPARVDKRCKALTEIVTVLYAMDYTEPEIYLQGLRHVTMEGSFGPPVDAAAHLRGLCAQGLTRTSHPTALEDVTNLLVDPEPPARIGAVRALAANGGPAGAIALRLKALTGDREAEVIAECFSGLMLSPSENSVSFVGRYVDSDDAEIAEAAILALGAARSARAVVVLKEKWEITIRGRLKKVLLLALASSRSEDALNFLLAQLETAQAPIAVEILNALAAQRPTASIRQSIEAAVQRRGDQILRDACSAAFSV
jgi:hypothetical protein